MAEYLGVEVRIAANDPISREFLEHAGAHRFVTQRCRDCGLLQYPPGTACEHCMSSNYEWAELSGAGTIYSYQIVEHPIHPAYRERVPYPVVLVELDEQRGEPVPEYALRVMATLVDAQGIPVPEAEVAIGKRVAVAFTDLGDGLGLPVFRLSDEPPEFTPWQFTSA